MSARQVVGRCPDYLQLAPTAKGGGARCSGSLPTAPRRLRIISTGCRTTVDLE